jgi:hypothetical protein
MKQSTDTYQGKEKDKSCGCILKKEEGKGENKMEDVREKHKDTHESQTPYQ